MNDTEFATALLQQIGRNNSGTGPNGSGGDGGTVTDGTNLGDGGGGGSGTDPKIMSPPTKKGNPEKLQQVLEDYHVNDELKAAVRGIGIEVFIELDNEAILDICDNSKVNAAILRTVRDKLGKSLATPKAFRSEREQVRDNDINRLRDVNPHASTQRNQYENRYRDDQYQRGFQGRYQNNIERNEFENWYEREDHDDTNRARHDNEIRSGPDSSNSGREVRPVDYQRGHPLGGPGDKAEPYGDPYTLGVVDAAGKLELLNDFGTQTGGRGNENRMPSEVERNVEPGKGYMLIKILSLNIAIKTTVKTNAPQRAKDLKLAVTLVDPYKWWELFGGDWVMNLKHYMAYTVNLYGIHESLVPKGYHNIGGLSYLAGIPGFGPETVAGIVGWTFGKLDGINLENFERSAGVSRALLETVDYDKNAGVIGTLANLEVACTVYLSGAFANSLLPIRTFLGNSMKIFHVNGVVMVETLNLGLQRIGGAMETGNTITLNDGTIMPLLKSADVAAALTAVFAEMESEFIDVEKISLIERRVKAKKDMNAFREKIILSSQKVKQKGGGGR